MKLLTLFVFLCLIILTNCQDLQSEDELDENEQSRMKRSHDLGRQTTPPRTKPINNNNLPVKTFNNKQQIPSKFKTAQKPMNLLLKTEHPSSTHIAIDFKAKNKETAPSNRNDIPAYLLYGYKQPIRRQPKLKGKSNISQANKVTEETNQKEEPTTTKKDCSTNLSDKAPELQVASVKLKENEHLENVVPKDRVDLHEIGQKPDKQNQPAIHIAPLCENNDTIPTQNQDKQVKVLEVSDIFFEEEESNEDIPGKIHTLDKNGTATGSIWNENSKNNTEFSESYDTIKHEDKNNAKPKDEETILKTKNLTNLKKEWEIEKIESKSKKINPNNTLSLPVNPASEGVNAVKLDIKHLAQEGVTKDPGEKTQKNLKTEQIKLDKIKIEPNETVIIDNRKVEEVVEMYKPPPFTPHTREVQTTWYSPQIWDYTPSNQAIPYTYNSVPSNGFYTHSAYNPFYDASKEFDISFVNKITDTPDNNSDHAYKKYYTNPNDRPKVKHGINKQKYNIGSLDNSFNQRVNHEKFKDTIWRTWKDTQIIVTRNQNNKGKPIEIELNQFLKEPTRNQADVYKLKTFSFNHRKPAIGLNGCYRNQNNLYYLSQ